MLKKSSLFLIAPYAAWILIMTLSPATAKWYAVRTAVTAALLVAFLFMWRGAFCWRMSLKAFGLGLLGGLVVLALWIAPEELFGWGKVVSAEPSPYSPEVCGWALTLVKLMGSAVVIAIAEELFFRKWLVDFAGFWWMIVLFAVEHGDRWFVGALAGLVYGWLALHHGLKSSMLAHGVTNFLLGLWVIFRGAWYFW